MDNTFMLRAVELARKGIGLTSPNPVVGSVVVHKGRIVAEGWHKKAGGDHAEIVAIKKFCKLGVDAAKCELYVTLEPCCHVGKTGPCTTAIIEAGFKKVFIGMRDPFSQVNGGGVKALKKAGVEVEFIGKKDGLIRQIAEINQSFLKWVRTALPYVVLKAGMSLDGKIATVAGESKWITSEVARKDGRMERGKYDAVLVGSGTVRKDDCELAALDKKKNLLRIIIDKDLSLPTTRKVFRDENVFVACTDLASVENQNRFLKAGVDFKSFGKSRVDIPQLLAYFGKWGVQSIFVEGGAKTHGAFFDSGNFDKVIFYIAPKIIGGEKSPSVIGGAGVTRLSEISDLGDMECEKIGKDLKVTAVRHFYS